MSEQIKEERFKMVDLYVKRNYVGEMCEIDLNIVASNKIYFALFVWEKIVFIYTFRVSCSVRFMLRYVCYRIINKSTYTSVN